MRSIPNRPKIALKVRLDRDAAQHNGYGYDDFAGFVRVYRNKNMSPNKAVLALFMNSSRDSIYNWLQELDETSAL